MSLTAIRARKRANVTERKSNPEWIVENPLKGEK